MALWELTTSFASRDIFASLSVADAATRIFGNSPIEIITNTAVIMAVFYILYIFVLESVIKIIKGVLDFFRLQKTSFTYIEVTPPHKSEKSPYATEQLMTILDSFVSMRGSRWSCVNSISLEMTSTRKDGVRYFIRVNEADAQGLKRHITTYLPDAKVRATSAGYEPKNTESAYVVELRQARHYAYPLQPLSDISQSDPVAYITGMMNKLNDDEAITLQTIITPHDSRRTIRLSNQIMHKGHAVIEARLRVFLVRRLWVWVIALIAGAIADVQFGLSVAVILFVVDLFIKRDPPELSDSVKKLYQDVLSKISQPLFKTSIRVMISADDDKRQQQFARGIISSLAPLATPGFQALRTSNHRPHVLSQKYRRFVFTHRLPALFNVDQNLYSASEISSIYHFPYGQIRTEDVARLRSRTLPVPLSIKANQDLDVAIGVSDHDEDRLPVGQTLAQRQKHTYIIGKTGTGKTTMLMSSIYQDMVNGKGLAVFDPHGDMFRELLKIVPEHRRKDVVVFDPSDRNNPIGLNILDPGIEFDNEDDKNEWITSTVLSVFAKLTDESQWGPRMEHILRNATLTALQLPNPTLYTIQRLLTDTKYQREATKVVDDPVLSQFWNKEFKMMGSMQRSGATAPLTHRIGHFITAKMSRHILLQEKSTVRVADVMNEGKILLVNLSKGDIGEDQSTFFGTILTSFIWMAAYQRTKIPEKQRRDFFVYVDEFQNFATPRFSEITSEGRKFHISLVVSHQNTAQIVDKSIIQIVAGNAATMICFTISPDDEMFILPYMKPELEKGDITNLEPYHFYAKINGDKSEDAFSGETTPLNTKGSDNTMNEVIAFSRKRYATPLAEVEKQMTGLFNQQKSKEIVKPTLTKTGKSKPKKRKKELLGL